MAIKRKVKILNISYKENGIEKHTTYQVKVKAKVEPPVEEKSNVGVVIGIAGGVAVVLGGTITAICLAKRKRKGIKNGNH